MVFRVRGRARGYEYWVPRRPVIIYIYNISPPAPIKFLCVFVLFLAKVSSVRKLDALGLCALSL